MKVLLEFDNAEKLYPAFANMAEIRIEGFYTNGTLCGYDHSGFLNITLNSLYRAVDFYKKRLIDAFIICDTPRIETLKAKIEILLNMEVAIDDIIIASNEFMLTGNINKLYKFQNYHRIPYIEYHVADNCNLNCKGCLHFAPLVKLNKFPVFDNVKRDFTKLKSIVPYIDTIRILGGEPLLNPELVSYLKMTRETYPLAEINIVTNGILLQNTNDALMNALKKYNIGVDISVYPPMFNKIDKIVDLLLSQGITVTCTRPITEFFCPLDKRSGHAKFTNEHHCACPNLYDGALYVCYIIAYLRYFNAAFGTNLNDVDGRIDIYKPNLTFDDIKEELHRVRIMCDSCNLLFREYAAKQKWSVTDKIEIKNYMTSEVL